MKKNESKATSDLTRSQSLSEPTVHARPRPFGTVRFGSHSMSALTAALIPGLVSGFVLGIIVASFMPQTMPWIIKALIVTAAFCPVSVSLCWVILVDTDTLPGADQHAGENIENHWYGKAEQLSYRIFLGVVSFSCLLASLLGKDQWAFMLVCILIAMLLVFVLAYTIMRFISRG